MLASRLGLASRALAHRRRQNSTIPSTRHGQASVAVTLMGHMCDLKNVFVHRQHASPNTIRSKTEFRTSSSFTPLDIVCFGDDANGFYPEKSYSQRCG